MSNLTAKQAIPGMWIVGAKGQFLALGMIRQSPRYFTFFPPPLIRPNTIAGSAPAAERAKVEKLQQIGIFGADSIDALLIAVEAVIA